MPAKKKRNTRRSGATRNTEQEGSKLSWVIMGILVGAFVAFLVYLDNMPSKQQREQQAAAKSSSKAITGAEKEAEPKEHQFDFYTILPDRQVEVSSPKENREKESRKTPKTETKPLTAPVAKASSSTADTSSLYQLQVGAFKELAKADAMKARLAFMGVESNIQLVQPKGQKLYRVRVGPMTDHKKIEQIQAQLKSQSINTFLQKL
jgi:cell division protein FtsN